MILTKYRCFFLLFVILFSIALKESCGDEVYTKNQKANKLFNEGKYEEALKLYEDALLLSPADKALKMNKGSALYRLDDYQKAQEEYLEALTHEDKKIRANAHYNLGNILFREGEQMYKSGNPQANEKFKNALEHYIQSLDLNPNDKDAKWNLQLAHQMIQQLEQDQDEQDDQDDQDKQDKQDKEQEQDKQDKQNQEQEQNQEQDKQDKDKEQEQQQAEEQEDLEKEEAMRIIELFSDDADSLNKPLQKKDASRKQPEQDW